MAKLDRKAFLQCLKTVEPALSDKDLVPKLRMMWFDKATVRATNAVIGIEAPCNAPIAGGLPGAILLGWVESLQKDEFTVEIQENAAHFACQKAKLTLPLEPPENTVWPFRIENAEPAGELTLDEDWRRALAFAMISVTNNAEQEQRRGVTFSPASDSSGEGVNASALNVYATDGQSVAWAKMEVVDWAPESFTVPGEFVKEALKVVSDGGRLLVREGSVEAINEQNVRAFSLMAHVDVPLDFAAVIRRHLPKHDMIDLPPDFKRSLERAELLKDDKVHQSATFEFKAGTGKNPEHHLVVDAVSSYGELHEELSVVGEHPLVKMHFVPTMLLRALDGRDAFAVSEHCVVLSGPENITYMLSAYRAKSE